MKKTPSFKNPMVQAAYDLSIANGFQPESNPLRLRKCAGPFPGMGLTVLTFSKRSKRITVYQDLFPPLLDPVLAKIEADTVTDKYLTAISSLYWK